MKDIEVSSTISPPSIASRHYLLRRLRKKYFVRLRFPSAAIKPALIRFDLRRGLKPCPFKTRQNRAFSRSLLGCPRLDRPAENTSVELSVGGRDSDVGACGYGMCVGIGRGYALAADGHQGNGVGIGMGTCIGRGKGIVRRKDGGAIGTGEVDGAVENRVPAPAG